MKRRDIKKLTLSRETLSNLDDQSLGEVAGGTKTDACVTAQWSNCGSCIRSCANCTSAC